MNKLDDELDDVLYASINHLLNAWHDKATGLVAAALVDVDKKVIATSKNTCSEQHWIHAERNAFQQFLQRYGTPSENAAFVTTLSPCIHQITTRVGESCIDLVEQSGVKRIHVGLLDPLHAASLDVYKQRGFQITLTRSIALRETCEKLFKLLKQYTTNNPLNIYLLKEKSTQMIFKGMPQHYV